MFKTIAIQERAQELMKETFEMYEEQIENHPNPGDALARAVAFRLAYHQEYIKSIEERLKHATKK